MTYAAEAVDAVAEALPGLDEDLCRLYAQLALVKGEKTSLEDVHDAWALWRLRTRPDHPSIVPFEELSPEVQELDWPYADAIRAVARLLKARR